METRATSKSSDTLLFGEKVCRKEIGRSVGLGN